MKPNYRADSSSVGEWNDAEQAASLWNQHILPILDEATKLDDETGEYIEPIISAGYGRAATANEWAWEEFCDRGAGDDESICMDIANELSEKLES